MAGLLTTVDGCEYEVLTPARRNGHREETAAYDPRLRALAATWDVTPEDLAAITPVGLKLRADAPAAQLRRLLAFTARAATGYAWAIGDLYNRLKHEGVTPDRMAEWSGLSPQTISSLGSHAAAYGKDERGYALSHSHYVALVALPPAERDATLRQAEAEHWTVARAREHAAEVLTPKPDATTPTPDAPAVNKGGRPRQAITHADAPDAAQGESEAIPATVEAPTTDGPRLRLRADLTARWLEKYAGDWANAELALAHLVEEALTR